MDMKPFPCAFRSESPLPKRKYAKLYGDTSHVSNKPPYHEYKGTEADQTSGKGGAVDRIV
jgi:hypothetical protein